MVGVKIEATKINRKGGCEVAKNLFLSDYCYKKQTQ